MIPCLDVAGVVVKVGENCRRVNVGMNVYGMAKAFGNTKFGAAAEYMAIPEVCLAMMPRNLDFVGAASLPLVALTTYQCCAHLMLDGTKVLILGGSGGVGSFAIQYAKARGCHVVSTCSERNVLLLEELGCDQIINYQNENWEEVLEGQKFDLIFDCVGGIDNWNNSHRVLRKNGSFVTIAGDVQTPLSASRILDIGLNLVGRNLKYLFTDSPSYSYTIAKGNKGSTQLLEIRHMVEGGLIKPIVDRETNLFSLENLHEAFEYSMSGKVIGKVVVLVDSEEFLNNELNEGLGDLDGQVNVEFVDLDG